MEILNLKKCACCEAEFLNYLPLPDYYKIQRKQYGVVQEPRPEMVNFKEYDCPNCGAADRDRAFALWIKREMIKDKKINILDVAPSQPLVNFIKKNLTSCGKKSSASKPPCSR